MVNKVTLIGNIGKTPELKVFENGSGVVSFSVATTENWKDKSGEWQSATEWHDVKCWRNAESLAGRLNKGQQVYVEGKIKRRSWEDKDGVKRYATDVVAQIVKPLGKREATDPIHDAVVAAIPQPPAKDKDGSNYPF